MKMEFSRKTTNVVKIIIAVLLLAVLGAWMVSYAYQPKEPPEDVQAGLAKDLVRLHVIANSDTEADQALKLKVRDAIIAYMKDKLANSKDVNETKSIINANLKNIEKVSKNVILQNNSKYSVKASLGNYSFPVKAYGDITLPAGEYQALRIVIGKGEGKNWWCVLFPPLCFVDATHGTIPDSVKKDLKNTLSEDEYNLITTYENEEDIPIKVKFKLVEFLEGTKVKLTGALNNMFK